MLLASSVALAADPPEPQFRHETIDAKIQIGYGVAAADVDGDKKIDILLADKTQFVWYRNPTWEKFVIAENLTKRDNVCLAAQDLDGDGKCELAVGADWAPDDRENSGAVFFMIPPADRTQKWEAVKLHAEPTVHRMRWVRLAEGNWGLIVAPLHGRGPDPAAKSRILLYLMPADPRAAWTTQIVDESMHATHNFDAPGPSHWFIVGREGLTGVRREDAGGRMTASHSSVVVSPAGEVRVTPKLIATVEPMHGNQLVVYAGGKRNVLTARMSEGHALAIGTITPESGEQIVVGWRGSGGGIRLFTLRDPALGDWRQSVVDDKGMACEDLCLADLDADGDLDIIASGRATKNVKIYWNETAK